MRRLLYHFFIIGIVYFTNIRVINAEQTSTEPSTHGKQGQKFDLSEIDTLKISSIQQRTLYRFDETSKRESVPSNVSAEHPPSQSNNSAEKADSTIPPALKVKKKVERIEDGKNQTEILLGQPQHFVPVTQFRTGPFSQPFNVNQGPRNFRHIPHPFANLGLSNFQGVRGSGRDFHRDNRYFNEAPVRGAFNGGMQFRPIRPPFHHQKPFFNQESINSDSHFHHDDPEDHTGAASHDLLGSGNFNIIRGGIFSDPENPPPHFRQHQRPTTNSDFFSGFRDFQPFTNALSVTHYRNAMQNLPSKINTVTVKKNKTIQKTRVKPMKLSIEKINVGKKV